MYNNYIEEVLIKKNHIAMNNYNLFDHLFFHFIYPL